MNEVVRFEPPRLPWADVVGDRFEDLGVDKTTWKALVENVYPSAKTIDSVIMVLSYCKARNLDPFKKPVHIVPIWNSNVGERGAMVDTVWQGISELRTTAMRTREYAGADRVEFGPMITKTFKGETGKGQYKKPLEETVTFPEWAHITLYRLVHGQRIAFEAPPVYWLETYAGIGKSGVPNDMWRKRPRGQLAKCAEAAALRFAFPEEMGSEYAAEEMEGQSIGPDNAKDITPRQDAKTALDNFSAKPETKAETVSEPEDTGLDRAKVLLDQIESSTVLDDLAAWWDMNSEEINGLGKAKDVIGKAFDLKMESLGGDK